LTNIVREILSCYKTATIPKHWKSLYPVHDAGLTMSAWLDDLVLRIQQVLSYSTALSSSATSSIVNVVNASTDVAFNVGRMFSPEAFIMACRQETAQVSIEDSEWFQ
jgi:hypothetical protein